MKCLCWSPVAMWKQITHPHVTITHYHLTVMSIVLDYISHNYQVMLVWAKCRNAHGGTSAVISDFDAFLMNSVLISISFQLLIIWKRQRKRYKVVRNLKNRETKTLKLRTWFSISLYKLNSWNSFNSVWLLVLPSCSVGNLANPMKNVLGRCCLSFFFLQHLGPHMKLNIAFNKARLGLKGLLLSSTVTQTSK